MELIMRYEYMPYEYMSIYAKLCEMKPGRQGRENKTYHLRLAIDRLVNQRGGRGRIGR
jgi:hypothetical protein